MEKAFSKWMSASEGRYLTPIEEERLLGLSLETSFRFAVSRWIQKAEYEIVDYATHAFCDVVGDFEAPAGSLRRKKGHQDGRIILRYVAQAIREGSTEIMFEKVLSWLVGHLDAGNVTGKHMEVFFHFLQQGVRRELPKSAHPFVDVAFEEVISCVRMASYGSTIHKAHRRIAEFAADRVMAVVSEAKAKYGASGLAKCKRDLELFVKEVARLMRSPTSSMFHRQLVSWLLDRLVSQVEYSSEVWYWTFLAVREGVVECCGPEAAEHLNDVFEKLADQSEAMQHSIRWGQMAGEIADIAAERLVQQGETLGLLRSDEFHTAVAAVNRQLISEIAILHASGTPEEFKNELAALWCETVLSQMPSHQTSLLASNLKSLLAVVAEKTESESAKAFRVWIEQLVEVAKRCEAVGRLSETVDAIAVETANWAIDHLTMFAADRRAAYRDLRLVLSKTLTLLPAGPAGSNGIQLRRYVTRFLLPNLPFPGTILKQVYEKAIQMVSAHTSSEDGKLIIGYLEEMVACIERHSRLHSIPSHMEKSIQNAVERGYHSQPDHESLSRHGLTAGKRDGAFLMEKVVEAAIVGGDQAEYDLHRYFVQEQVRLSKLPGKIVVEFIRGLLEQVREHSEVSSLLLRLAQAAPLYTSSIAIRRHGNEWGMSASKQTMELAPTYREQIGPTGLEACARDNSIMLRSLAHHLTHSPFDVALFKAWWRRRIGKNIRVKPESFSATAPCAQINFDQITSILRKNLDRDESDAVIAYLNQIFQKSPGSETNRGRGSSLRGSISIPNMPAISSFSDVVGAMN